TILSRVLVVPMDMDNCAESVGRRGASRHVAVTQIPVKTACRCRRRAVHRNQPADFNTVWSGNMDRLGKRVVALFTATAIGLSGCGLSKQRKLTNDEYENASVYDSTSLALEEPVYERDDPFDLSATAPPITIQDDEPPAYWEMNLERAVQIALENSKVLRDLGG